MRKQERFFSKIVIIVFAAMWSFAVNPTGYAFADYVCDPQKDGGLSCCQARFSLTGLEHSKSRMEQFSHLFTIDRETYRNIKEQLTTDTFEEFPKKYPKIHKLFGNNFGDFRFNLQQLNKNKTFTIIKGSDQNIDISEIVKDSYFYSSKRAFNEYSKCRESYAKRHDDELHAWIDSADNKFITVKFYFGGEENKIGDINLAVDGVTDFQSGQTYIYPFAKIKKDEDKKSKLKRKNPAKFIFKRGEDGPEFDLIISVLKKNNGKIVLPKRIIHLTAPEFFKVRAVPEFHPIKSEQMESICSHKKSTSRTVNPVFKNINKGDGWVFLTSTARIISAPFDNDLKKRPKISTARFAKKTEQAIMVQLLCKAQSIYQAGIKANVAVDQWRLVYVIDQ